MDSLGLGSTKEELHRLVKGTSTRGLKPTKKKSRINQVRARAPHPRPRG
jgi:hypothetical protein